MRMVKLSSGLVSTLAGRPTFSGRLDGAGTLALFSSPSGVVMDAIGSMALVVSLVVHIRVGQCFVGRIRHPPRMCLPAG